MNEMEKKSNQLTIALVQFDIKWEDAASNRTYLSAILKDLPESVDLIILPEAFSTGFSMNAQKVAESMSGETVRWMKTIAVQKNAVICGGLFIRENGKVYNRFVWVDPEGKEFVYDKRHLFSMEGESVNYTSGNKTLLIEYKGWKIFPQICYDLRFPVWGRNTSEYDLMINIANWPASRRKVWKTLLKARAIENQCYVAAVNRVGVDGNSIDYCGDSMMIDYKGLLMIIRKQSEGIQVLSLDKDNLALFRNKFNTLKDADRFSIEN
jgi:predicted amidohydrolase